MLASGLLVLLPVATLIAGAVWVVTFYASRYVSLASLIAALVLPGAAWFLGASRVLVGFAAIIAVSVTAFTAFKVVGAIYLFWLGLLAFREALRRRAHAADGDQEDATVAPSPFVRMLQRWGPARLSTSPAAQGVVSSVTNPKTAVFFLTFLPQYLDPTGNVLAEALVLTCLLSVVSVVWLGAYIWAIGLIAPFLRRPRVRRRGGGIHRFEPGEIGDHPHRPERPTSERTL